MKNPNVNCLEGWKCPKCESFGPFKINATINATVTMHDDGVHDQDNSETSWEAESYTECCECGHEATVKCFTPDMY